MIEKKFRWYHYFMLSFHAQMAIVLGCMMVWLIQFVVYSTIDRPVMVFDGECEVTVGPVRDNGDVYSGAWMDCGGETRGLDDLEVTYLYNTLTTGLEPVIVCAKTESKFLGSITWECQLDPQSETEQL